MSVFDTYCENIFLKRAFYRKFQILSALSLIPLILLALVATYFAFQDYSFTQKELEGIEVLQAFYLKGSDSHGRKIEKELSENASKRIESYFPGRVFNTNADYQNALLDLSEKSNLILDPQKYTYNLIYLIFEISNQIVFQEIIKYSEMNRLQLDLDLILRLQLNPKLRKDISRFIEVLSTHPLSEHELRNEAQLLSLQLIDIVHAEISRRNLIDVTILSATILMAVFLYSLVKTTQKIASKTVLSEIDHLRSWIDSLHENTAIRPGIFPGEDELKEISNSIEILTDKLMKDAKELEVAKDAALRATQAKSVFLANMTHEIRTPLSGMLIAIELLSEKNLDSEAKELATDIQTSTNSLLAIINDILDVSKIESGKLEIIPKVGKLSDLVDAVSATFRASAHQKSIQILIHTDKMLPLEFSFDMFRLRQVVINLVGNALKFTPPGGILIMYISGMQVQNSDWILSIDVADSGIGISNDKLSEIFQPFSQADSSISRKYGGTGLGLTISKQIIELMNGTISVESIENIGTRFTVTIPVVASEMSYEKDKESLDPDVRENITNKKILLAEDNVVNQKLLQTILTREGMHVELVSDGKEAFEKWQTGSFDLILMDFSMPRYDGVWGVRAIRDYERLNTLNKTPIIIVSAHSTKDCTDELLAIGVDSYVEKPLKKEQLIQAMIKLMS